MGGAKHLGALPCRRQCRWAWELKNGWQAATNVVCCALVWAGEGQQGGTSNLHGTHWLTQHPPIDCMHPHTNPCGARHLNCTSAVWLLLGRVYSQAPCLLAARCMTTNSHHPSPTTTTHHHHPPPPTPSGGGVHASEGRQPGTQCGRLHRRPLPGPAQLRWGSGVGLVSWGSRACSTQVG